MKKTSLKVLLGTVMILVFISTLFIFSKVNATETQEREVDYSDENNLDGEVSEDLDVNEGFTEDDTFTADDLTDSSEIYEKDLYEFSQGDYTLEKIVNGNVFSFSKILFHVFSLYPNKHPSRPRVITILSPISKRILLGIMILPFKSIL